MSSLICNTEQQIFPKNKNNNENYFQEQKYAGAKMNFATKNCNS